MATFRVRNRGSSPATVGGKIASSLFLLVFAGVGLVMTVMFGRMMLGGMAPWRWERAECRVLTSGVEELLFSLPPDKAAVEDKPYRLNVAFEWRRGASAHRGDQVGGGAQYGSRRAAEEAASRVPAGSLVPCYVDPGDPTAAVLRRPRLWSLLLLGFPLIFVAFGVGGIIGVWRGGRRAPDGATTPRSQVTSPRAGRGCGLAAFGIFALAGAGFLLVFAFPAARKARSLGWEKVPATIVWSGVGSHSDDDSTTYSVDVLYEYDRGGQRHRANRYRFFGGSSSGEAGKREVVDRLPPGARVDAWVDPHDPSSAVLDRSLGPFMWFALLPLLFVTVGLGGMVMVLRSGAGKPKPLAWLPGAPDGDAAVVPLAVDSAGVVRELPPGALAGGGQPLVPRGPIALRPGKSRIGSFVAILLFTLVWDGGVGFAIWALARDGKIGHDGCATAFVAVFALVGVLLLISLPHQFLALFNPRAEMSLSAPPAPGVPVALSWRFHGAAGRIGRLTLQVEGSEVAVFRRGTDTVTERRVFARLVLLDTTDPGQIAGGETLLALPGDTMHSFEAPHNKVVWTLKLHGDIARWPDIDDEVALTVYPAALT